MPLDDYIKGAEAHEEKSSSGRNRDFFIQKLLTDKHLPNVQQLLPKLCKELHPDATTESGRGDAVSDQVLSEAEELCLRLCRTDYSHSKGIDLLEELERSLAALIAHHNRNEFRLFHNDIKEQLRTLTARGTDSYEGWTVTLTDDACDLLLLAKETSGCQSIDGEPHLVKCALAYPADGKNRAVVVKDPSGKIRRRAVLRLLEGESSETPVLFLERQYTSSSDTRLIQVVTQYAIDVAKLLNLPLTTREADAQAVQPFGERLISRGSRVPYEYSDGSDTNVTDGRFRIPIPLTMWAPKKIAPEAE